jgi:hypothetical protein
MRSAAQFCLASSAVCNAIQGMDQRVLLSFSRIALSADFHVICWESRLSRHTVVPLTDGGSELSGLGRDFMGSLSKMNSFECWKIWASLSNA